MWSKGTWTLVCCAAQVACTRPEAGAPARAVVDAGASVAVPTAASQSRKGSALPSGVECIVHHYDVELAPSGRALTTRAGDTIPFDDGRTKTTEERLEAPDVKDMFAMRYPARGAPIAAPKGPDDDPGRVRVEAFFRATYGKTARDVEARLVTVTVGGVKMRVHERVKEPFLKVAARLEPLLKDPDVRKFFDDIGGTYNYRKIAGTDRMSAHAYGIAVDLAVKHSAYWRNGGTWSNRLPQSLVDAFEAEGFVWGGRWAHFDTMHFEYRPELFDPAC